VHAVLDRSGLVKRRKRRCHKAQGTELRAAHAPNGLWCADFKGEFMLGHKQYCDPLTITDYRSRYRLACEGLSSTRSAFAFSVFERAFKDFGLPAAIRTDNRKNPKRTKGWVVGGAYRSSTSLLLVTDSPQRPLMERLLRTPFPPPVT